MPVRHIFLTGEVQVGKSTLLTQALCALLFIHLLDRLI